MAARVPWSNPPILWFGSLCTALVLVVPACDSTSEPSDGNGDGAGGDGDTDGLPVCQVAHGQGREGGCTYSVLLGGKLIARRDCAVSAVYSEALRTDTQEWLHTGTVQVFPQPISADPTDVPDQLNPQVDEDGLRRKFSGALLLRGDWTSYEGKTFSSYEDNLIGFYVDYDQRGDYDIGTPAGEGGASADWTDLLESDVNLVKVNCNNTSDELVEGEVKLDEVTTICHSDTPNVRTWGYDVHGSIHATCRGAAGPEKLGDGTWVDNTAEITVQIEF